MLVEARAPPSPNLSFFEYACTCIRVYLYTCIRVYRLWRGVTLTGEVLHFGPSYLRRSHPGRACGRGAGPVRAYLPALRVGELRVRNPKNPRVNVTLKPEQYELVSRLAVLQKRSRADVLRDLFETVMPVLERVAVVSEAAVRASNQAKEGLRESVEAAEEAIRPHVLASLAQFDIFAQSLGGAAGEGSAGSPARAERPPESVPTPVAVTTGVRSLPRNGRRRVTSGVSRSARRKK